MIDREFELQGLNGDRRRAGEFEEIGTSGLESWSGWIHQAYNRELYWPQAAPLYQRIWRSDPETTVVRGLFSAWSGKLSPEWIVPEMKAPDGELLPASDDDKAAAYFANTAMEDIEGGIDSWLTSAITRAPFFGWGFWETVSGVRKAGWRPPGDEPWESKYDDGLVGIRKLALRDYSSFDSWDIDDGTGRVRGMRQNDPPNHRVTIPSNRAVHIRYGDMDNPEGLATLEAIWRLERIKYGLELIQGIGFEHAAGHSVFEVYGGLTDEAKAVLKKAARALTSAKEGNYITELYDAEGNPVFKARVMDVPFQAGPAILEAIRYYGILKLALYGMQFVAVSSLSDSGSYAAMSDASEMALLMFNNIASGIVKQASEQIGARLFERNRDAFPGMTRRPELAVNELEKPIPLAELGAFVTAMNAVMPLGEDDVISIRSKSSGVLADAPPEEAMIQEQEPEQEIEDDMPDGTEAVTDEASGREDDAPDGELSELAQRNVLLPEDEQPTLTSREPLDLAAEAERVVRRFRRWAGDHEPRLAKLLDAEFVEEDESEDDNAI